MSDMLSQDEINALLGGIDSDTEDTTVNDDSAEAAQELESGSYDEMLTNDEKDAIGEISNISMGSAATTLSTLVNRKVLITTPSVKVSNWPTFVSENTIPSVSIEIRYKEGLEGKNVLVLDENDAKVITDLMMGGDGSNTDEELNDLHLSAISEAMNQMIGASATAMSQIFDRKIDIMPPIATKMDLKEEHEDVESFSGLMDDHFIQIDFRIQVEGLVDNTLSQIYPMEFAKIVIDSFKSASKGEDNQEQVAQARPAEKPKATSDSSPIASGPQPSPSPNISSHDQPVEVRPAQFETFSPQETIVKQRENIDLIMDVNLEVTVELGRTRRTIKEILDFSPGSIIELNKLSGEPVDVLVNGKIVAKGEVVVIDENFSVRITEIIKNRVTN